MDKKAKKKIKDANSTYVKFTSNTKNKKNHFKLVTTNA
jgi:hypothetical protein